MRFGMDIHETKILALFFFTGRTKWRSYDKFEEFLHTWKDLEHLNTER